MFEPRGHDVMSGSILYPPTNPDSDVAILFIETSGCLAMCGHGTIGTVTLAIEHGLIRPKTPGVVRTRHARPEPLFRNQAGRRTRREVRITNVRIVHAFQRTRGCPGLGRLSVDVAIGKKLLHDK